MWFRFEKKIEIQVILMQLWTKRVQRKCSNKWLLSFKVTPFLKWLYFIFLSLVENTLFNHFTQCGRLWDHPHAQHFAYSPHVSRLITFPPHELVVFSMAGKSARKSQRRRGQSRDTKTRQATHLWDPNAAVGELGDCLERFFPVGVSQVLRQSEVGNH